MKYDTAKHFCFSLYNRVIFYLKNKYKVKIERRKKTILQVLSDKIVRKFIYSFI